ncbi:MAG: PLP-dependent decarboxylase, partial [Chloroflexota bacterium]|nr:PLP-dependent decarboxylase [Chloroflexota bacterium]
MHHHLFDFTPDMGKLLDRTVQFAKGRIGHEVESLQPPPPSGALDDALTRTITPAGLGAEAAFEIFERTIAANCQAVDNPRFLAFVSHPPATASTIFDMAISAATIFGTSWLEAAGATAAENAALHWLAELTGMPEGAGGTFLSGATIANLNALAAARAKWRAEHPEHTGRLAVAMTCEAHASARMVARVLDFEILDVPADERGRLTGPNLSTALEATELDVCAVVATGGITNVGIVDDLAGAAEISAAHGLWFHVDAAYGGAALLVPEVRLLFAGIERADSVVIDPHKWLFTPLDCSALLYREPGHARAAFTQHADYIAAFQEVGEWNPGDYAAHLTRRARGLPFWFLLATYGTDAVAKAVGESIDLARQTARLIDADPKLTLLMEPELSVVVFRRNGWTMREYGEWCDHLLAEGTAFILPTLLRGEPC